MQNCYSRIPTLIDNPRDTGNLLPQCTASQSEFTPSCTTKIFGNTFSSLSGARIGKSSLFCKSAGPLSQLSVLLQVVLPPTMNRLFRQISSSAFRHQSRNIHAKITVLPGDGIGPEIIAEAVKCLNTVAKVRNHQFEFDEQPMGGAAIDLTGIQFFRCGSAV